MTEKLTYKEKFEIMDREALATLACAIVITALFWLAILLLKDSRETFFMMPLWFAVSCLGGYLLSIAGVILIVKLWFKDFDLESDAPEAKEKSR